VNIWALRKNARLKQALLMLSECLSGFAISDDDPATEEAVRLAATDGSCFSVYLFTYGQTAGRYGIHLEYPPHPEAAAGRIVEEQEEVELSRLGELLEIHFYAG